MPPSAVQKSASQPFFSMLQALKPAMGRDAWIPPPTFREEAPVVFHLSASSAFIIN